MSKIGSSVQTERPSAKVVEKSRALQDHRTQGRPGLMRGREEDSMVAETKYTQGSGARTLTPKRWRRIAWLAILLADAGLLLWGAMAALAPEHLLGPGSAPILNAEYWGFSGHSWAELTGTSPTTAGFVTLLFRMYGTYGVVFAMLAIVIAVTAFRRGERWAWWALLVGNTLAFGAAMAYDRIVGAIGPFELSEYLGIAAVYAALAVSARFSLGRGGPQKPDDAEAG